MIASAQADLFQRTPPPSIPHAPFVRSSDTSRAAARFIEPRLGRLEKVVYDYIKAQPDGATCEDVEKATGMKHQTASARISGIGDGSKKHPEKYPGKKLIYDTGQTRQTDSGIPASVWKAKTTGENAAE
jgi:hypothetical protein